MLFVAGTRGVLEHLRTGKADVGATHCALAPSGALTKHPWTDDDHVRVLAMGGPIPCDAICAGPGFDGAARAALRAALLKSPPELLAAFEASGMREPDATLYEVFRMAYSD